MSSQDISARRERLAPAQLALLEKRLRGKPKAESEQNRITRRSEQGPVPLAYFQERLWFSLETEATNPIWNAPAAIRLEGRLDVAALERALTEIVRRHEVLRVKFYVEAGQPVQVVCPVQDISLRVIPLEDLDESERDDRAMWLAGEEARQPFDLSQSPLVRGTLFRFTPTDHLLLLTFHHITFDGWSKGILFRELVTLYAAFATGQPSPLPELPIQYTDFAVWHRQWMNGEVLKKQLDYWTKQLEAAPLLKLPTDYPRPAMRTFAGERLWISLPETTSAALLELAEKQAVTPFVALLAAFAVQAACLSGQQDIVIGTHVAGRARPEVEGLIGFFINQLVLRNDLSGNPSFRELLSRVQQVTLDAFEHQEIPFEKIVESMAVEQEPGAHPFFQVMFTFHNAPWTPVSIAGLTPQWVKFDDRLVRYDIEFDLWRGPRSIEGMFVYSTSLFSPETARRMIAGYQRLLERLVVNPDMPWSELCANEEGMICSSR